MRATVGTRRLSRPTTALVVTASFARPFESQGIAPSSPVRNASA